MQLITFEVCDIYETSKFTNAYAKGRLVDVTFSSFQTS